MADWVCGLSGQGGAPVWRIARSRAEAISIMCGMLGRGIGVEEIGPPREMPDSEIIDSGEIRTIDTMQDQHHG